MIHEYGEKTPSRIDSFLTYAVKMPSPLAEYLQWQSEANACIVIKNVNVIELFLLLLTVFTVFSSSHNAFQSFNRPKRLCLCAFNSYLLRQLCNHMTISTVVKSGCLQTQFVHYVKMCRHGLVIEPFFYYKVS